jgi:hypothetical protein
VFSKNAGRKEGCNFLSALTTATTMGAAMADSVTTSKNPPREFLDDLEGDLNHVQGLLQALTHLTTMTPLDQRITSAEPADAVLLAAVNAVEDMKSRLASVLYPRLEGEIEANG